mgnify:CR=1 FL=1
MQLANVGIALGAFVRTLVTRSRFDDYLDGNTFALTPIEIEGLENFMVLGCSGCHKSPSIGGTVKRSLGVKFPYEANLRGRQFKVPGLRNVAKTGPYLHDGSISDLRQVIEIMAYHQLGKKLETEQVDSIEAFLGTLTGRIEPRHIARPLLPQ